MKFTEAQLESAIIELLGAEGYPHVLGEAIERQPQDVLIEADLRTFLSRQYAADKITPVEIEAVIQRLKAYSAADLYESNKAIMRLVSEGFHLKRERTLTPGPSPKERGEKEISSSPSGRSQDEGLQNSSSPSGRSGDEGRSQRDLYIQLIDYSELVAFREPKAGEAPMILAEDAVVYRAGGNIFKIVNQLEIVGYEKRIPDGILYINQAFRSTEDGNIFYI